MKTITTVISSFSKKMNVRIGVFLFLLINLCSSQLKANEMDSIRVHFIETYASLDVDTVLIQGLLDNIQADGTWPDVDYESTRTSNWPTRVHVDYCDYLGRAYVNEETKYYKSEEVKSALLQALYHWGNEDYQNDNWYNGQIGVPIRMAVPLLLLDDEAPEDLLTLCRPILNRTFIQKTGQNRVHTVQIVFMRGLLYNIPSEMETASKEIWKLLIVTTGEGLQPDWSFHQHGAQQQIGNYGLHFEESMVPFASYTRETTYSASNDKLKLLRNYNLECLRWALWKGVLDISACGRELPENGPEGKGKRLSAMIKAMANADPQYAQEYMNAVETTTNHLSGY